MAPHLDNDAATANSTPAEIKLVTISAANLLNGDKQTQDDLLDACTSLGFFYLDCRDHPFQPTMSLVDKVSTMALEFYDLPLASKDEWTKLSFDEVKVVPFALVLTPSQSPSGILLTVCKDTNQLANKKGP